MKAEKIKVGDKIEIRKYKETSDKWVYFGLLLLTEIVIYTLFSSVFVYMNIVDATSYFMGSGLVGVGLILFTYWVADIEKTVTIKHYDQVVTFMGVRK